MRDRNAKVRETEMRYLEEDLFGWGTPRGHKTIPPSS